MADWKSKALLSLAGTASVALIVALTFVYLSRPDDDMMAHIIPPWYLLPFYAILRSVPDKLGGVILVFSTFLLACAWPWIGGRNWQNLWTTRAGKTALAVLAFVPPTLLFCGARLPDDPFLPSLASPRLFDADLNSFVWLSRLAVAYLFAFFLVLIPYVCWRPAPAASASPSTSG